MRGVLERGGRTVVAIAAVGAFAVGAAGAAARNAADTTPPTISGASDITVPATSDCNQTFCATVTWPFTASDPDDPPDQITVTCNNPNGQTYSWGQSYTTCQAKDAAGNLSAPVSFTVTVTVPPPTFQVVPGSLSFPASGPAGGPATFATPTAVDVGGQSVPVTCDHQSGIVYPIGVTTVTCTAQITRNDSQGTPISGLPSASTQFTITITQPTGGGGGSTGGGGGGSTGGGGGSGGGPTPTPTPTLDTTPPTLRPHRNVRVAASSGRGARVAYTVVAQDVDNQPGSLIVTCSPASGSTFHLGSRGATRTTTVTCSARDPSGNRSPTTAFMVTVLGAHDQVVALLRQVRALRVLTGARRAGLTSTLQQAGRAILRRARGKAEAELAAFITQVGHARTTPSTRRQWVGEAARIITVLG
jgi:hypothetical protein